MVAKRAEEKKCDSKKGVTRNERCPKVSMSVLGSWVKPRGRGWGIRKGEKGAVRLPKMLVLSAGVKRQGVSPPPPPPPDAAAALAVGHPRR